MLQLSRLPRLAMTMGAVTGSSQVLEADPLGLFWALLAR